jgi:RND family efflux transporter MFP subunit
LQQRYRCGSIGFRPLTKEDRTIREQLEALRIDRSGARERRPRRWPWFLLAVIVLGAATSAAVVWWPAGATEVQTVTVREEDGSAGATVLNATGYVTARLRATIASEITGRLVELRIEEGMPIAKGDVVARLDDKLYRAALDLAESQLAAARRVVRETEVDIELAELTLQRTTKLLDDGVVGQAAYDDDRARLQGLRARHASVEQQVAVAEREVAVRRAELSNTVIRSPFAGIVISKDAHIGEMVSPISAGGGFTRTGICTVVDMNSLEIEVDVNESYISRVRPDQRVEAVLDAYPDWRIPARVITTIPAADRQKATVEVRIAFEELDPRILPDMGVKVAFRGEEIEAGDVSRPRVLIPSAAVRQRDGKDLVFLVSDGRAERRAVRLGGEAGDRVEVVAGLNAGERVIVNAPADMSDGDSVSVR